MIETKKDVVFWSVCVCWLMSNIVSYILFKDLGIVFSNISFMILMCVMILLKGKNRNFNNWLETPLKTKNNDK